MDDSRNLLHIFELMNNFSPRFTPTHEQLDSIGFESDGASGWYLKIQDEVISYFEGPRSWRLNDSHLDPQDFNEIIQLAYTLNRGEDYMNRVRKYNKEKK